MFSRVVSSVAGAGAAIWWDRGGGFRLGGATRGGGRGAVAPARGQTRKGFEPWGLRLGKRAASRKIFKRVVRRNLTFSVFYLNLFLSVCFGIFCVRLGILLVCSYGFGFVALWLRVFLGRPGQIYGGKDYKVESDSANWQSRTHLAFAAYA